MNTFTAGFTTGVLTALAGGAITYYLGLDILTARVHLRMRAHALRLGQRWRGKPHTHPAYWAARSHTAIRNFGRIGYQLAIRPKQTIALIRTVRSLPPFQQSAELTAAITEAAHLHTTGAGVVRAHLPVRARWAPATGYTYDLSLCVFRHADGAISRVTLGGAAHCEVSPTPERETSRDRVAAALALYPPSGSIPSITIRL